VGSGAPKTVGAEQGSGPVVQKAGGRRAVEERRPEGVQPTVADVENLAGVEQVHPVERDGPLAGHDPHSGEGADHPCLGCGLQQRPQTAGVVPVGVGDPHPAHVGGVHHLGERRHEILAGGAEAGVDDNGVLGVQDEGVDRQEPEAGNLHVVVEDCDITDPVNLHGVVPVRQKGS
jgi:hypothetical protein